MKKEWIKLHSKETAVKVSNTEVEAVRVKDIGKQAVRVYQDEKIGIAGAVGEISEDDLTARAVENLDAGIRYPYHLEGPIKAERNFTKNVINSQDLLQITEAILEVFRNEFKDYRFSHMVTMSEKNMTMTNTQGLDLTYKDAVLQLEFIFKEKNSANLMDGFTGYRGRHFDLDHYLDGQRKQMHAFGQKEKLPEGRIPVFFADADNEVLFSFLKRALNGEQYAKGSSIFSGKLGQVLFDPRVTLYQSRQSEKMYQPFFDTEGCIMPSDKIPMIDRGKLVHVAADKRTAAKHGIPHTGSASGAYDSKPSLWDLPLCFAETGQSAKAALNGQLALYVSMASGGDFTSEGNFASPVQGAYLFDGEQLIARLPECVVRGNLYDLLGKGYIGTFKSPLYVGEQETITGYYLDVKAL